MDSFKEKHATIIWEAAERNDSVALSVVDRPAFQALTDTALKRRIEQGAHRHRRALQRERVRRLSRYGLTALKFDEMAREAGGCEICGVQPPMLHVDHDHSSGAVRGLLCRGCNVALGTFGDDPQRLIKAAAYLLGFRKNGRGTK